MQRSLFLAILAALTIAGISPAQAGQILLYEDFEGTPEGQVPSSLHLIGAGATDFAKVTRSAARSGEKGLYADLIQRSEVRGQYSWGERADFATPTSEVNFYTVKASIAYQALQAPGAASYLQFTLDGLIGSTKTAVAVVRFYNDGRLELFSDTSFNTTYAPLSYQDFEITYHTYTQEVDFLINGEHVFSTLNANWRQGPDSFVPTSVSFTTTANQQLAEYIMLDNISVEASYVAPPPVPEPSSMLLGMVGVAGVGLLVRRKSKTA